MPTELKAQLKEALETYNKYALVYIKYLESKLLQYQLYNFTSKLPKSAKILDVGCGAGRDVEYLTQDGFDVIGIDISDVLLEEARKKSLNVKKMNLTKMDFAPNLFDGIWCMATLSDIPKKEVKKVLSNFNEILKQGGVIYIAVKEGEGEKIIEKERYDNAPRFYAFYKKEELESIIIKANFFILESKISKDEKNSWIEILARKK